MKTKIALAAAAAALLSAIPANAATYALTYAPTGAGINGPTVANPATFTISTADTLNAAGGYDVLAGFGNVAGDAVSLIINPGQPNTSVSPAGAFFYDNVFYTAASPTGATGVDLNGLLFGSAAGVEYNLYSNDATTYALDSFTPGVGYAGSTGTLASAAVPEPATWGMMLLGFGMLGMGLRARRRDVKVSFA